MNQHEKPAAGETVAIMHTNKGDLSFRLFPEKSPKTVENFTTHAKNGYYDGVGFHRIIPDFMIQGGDPLGNGTGGESIWGGTFEDECVPELLNVRGALSMANAGPGYNGEGTNGSQFFIVTTEACSWLNGKHTVFGQLFDGMAVADAISALPTDAMDRPKEPVTITSIDVVEYAG